MFEFMLRPFLECLILVGIHSYLGLHVIRRRVIFVDLALAQIAALGTIVGGLLGLMEGTAPAMTYSLLFCLIGAALFAFTRVRHDRIPQEAVIGLVYAITFALAILVVQKTEGVEHMEGILVGNLLFVKWSDIIATLVAYVLIGGFHIIYGKRFLLISDYPEKAYRQGINVRLWDFLFYATFGFVITFSTKVAGVLLVFVFLVAPAIMAVMITKTFKKQLLVGWGSGTLVTVVGLYLAAHPDIDLPAGPTVVAFYGIVLALSAVVVYLVRSRNRLRALVHTGVGLVVVAVLVCGMWGLGVALSGLSDEGLGGHHHGHHHGPSLSAQVDCPAPAPAAVAGKAAVEAETEEVLPGDRLEKIKGELKKESPQGLKELMAFLQEKDTPEFYCEDALEVLRQQAGKDFGFCCGKTVAENKNACQEMLDWLDKKCVPAPDPG